jgi:hypothetical protein
MIDIQTPVSTGVMTVCNHGPVVTAAGKFRQARHLVLVQRVVEMMSLSIISKGPTTQVYHGLDKTKGHGGHRSLVDLTKFKNK